MEILQTGIDISKWQGDFDMARALSEGFTFVIVKGGGADVGFYIDKKFEQNYANAKKLKMPVGCYWFSKALSKDDAKKEAEWFYENCLKNKQFELPIYMDVEHKEMLALSQRELTDIVHAFCQKLEKLGFLAGIYSSTGAYNAYFIDEEFARYPVWVAQYNNVCTYKGKYGMWQYGGGTNFIRSNQVAGVVCDQNYLYVDYESVIKEKGLNGFVKMEEPENNEEKVFASEEFILVYDLEKDGESYVSENFRVREFRSNESSAIFIHPKLIEWCQSARDHFQTPLTIRRAYDIKDDGTLHCFGKAVDILANDKASAYDMYYYFSRLFKDKYEICLCEWGIHLGISEEKKRLVRV